MARHNIFGLSLAILLGGTVAAAAQSAVVVTRSAPPTMGPAEQAYVETYVARHPYAPAGVPAGYRPVVGAAVPADVALATFPAPAPVHATAYPQADDDGNWDGGDDGRAVRARALAGYRYMVTPSAQTVVVEPGTREIIHVFR